VPLQVLPHPRRVLWKMKNPCGCHFSYPSAALDGLLPRAFHAQQSLLADGTLLLNDSHTLRLISARRRDTDVFDTAVPPSDAAERGERGAAAHRPPCPSPWMGGG
jgi:hypothetical protein